MVSEGLPAREIAETDPQELATGGTEGRREKLESEMTSTFQAWVARKVVVTLTGMSESAGRAMWGGGK